MYRAVVKGKQGLLRATALAGMHSIVLGFDHPQADDFLGFAVHRTDRTSDESWWLTGQIRFQGDPADFGEDVPTNRAPLQKFHWGDYTTRPGHDYTYRVHAVHGKPDALELSDPVELSVRAASNRPDGIGVYFNRGVTAARAYRLRFGDNPPDEVPDHAAYRWLSRGLEDALLEFLAAAQGGDELKVAIYEFEHAGVVEALAAAKARGVRLRLVYHARPGDDQTEENELHLRTLELPAADVRPRTRIPNISHNKFVIHCRAGTPLRVWTGSTNFTEAGLFLQTNVGLVLPDAGVARAYDAYFEVLFRDSAVAKTRKEVEALVAGQSGPGPSSLFFAPVSGTEILEKARAMIAGARQAIFISCPFGIDKTIADALNANPVGVVEYGLLNVTSRKRLVEVVDRSMNSWFATPQFVRQYDGGLWDAQAYGNHKIHVKSLVTDPWSSRPRVLIGSANFSDESARLNDENSLYRERDRRLAAIVATEFLRMFDHYKFRDYVIRAKKDVGIRHLAEDGSWADDYFDPKQPKLLERMAFAQV
jgi:phosphatidylserine/phosphatidylglycerophosphate/cardiolipin synthase-like enzyme